MGDGPLVWGEEAREGGVLTVVREALRCSARNFSPIQPPPPNRPTPPHPTQLTPALRRPRLAPNYNHTVLPSALPSLQSLECSNPSSSASGHKTEVQLQYLRVPTQTCQRRIQIELLRLLDTYIVTQQKSPAAHVGRYKGVTYYDDKVPIMHKTQVVAQQPAETCGCHTGEDSNNAQCKLSCYWQVKTGSSRRAVPGARVEFTHL